VARCFAFVGPYLPLNQHFAIGNFIQSALLNENIEIKGDGTPLRTYLYTSDLCVWLIKVLLNGLPNCIYNVGGGDVLSIRELADVVKDQLNSTIKVNVHQLPCGVLDAYIPNLDKIRNELGLYPTVLIREAISKTANWNMKHADI
jgi:dTDP-glucose 4,6-dehydratase